MTTPAPEQHGIPARAVLDLLDDLERPGLEPHALTVTHHGAPVVEGVWAPYRADLPGLVYSVSKTFTSAAIGHLVAEGRLAVDDLAGTILGLPDPTGITVRHLLSMNTGHSAEQVAALGFDSRDLLGTVPAHAPGTHFVYNSQASMTLSSIVTALTGQRLTEYLRPRMLEPLGIDDPWWVPHRDGDLDIDQGFSGLHLTIGQLTRLTVALADGDIDAADNALRDHLRLVFADIEAIRAEHPEMFDEDGTAPLRRRHRSARTDEPARPSDGS